MEMSDLHRQKFSSPPGLFERASNHFKCQGFSIISFTPFAYFEGTREAKAHVTSITIRSFRDFQARIIIEKTINERHGAVRKIDRLAVWYRNILYDSRGKYSTLKGSESKVDVLYERSSLLQRF